MKVGNIAFDVEKAYITLLKLHKLLRIIFISYVAWVWVK